MQQGLAQRAPGLHRHAHAAVGHGARGRKELARSFARLAANDEALASLSSVVQDGFFCYPAFVTDPWLDGVRHLQTFRELLKTAQSRHEVAREAFHGAGGELS